MKCAKIYNARAQLLFSSLNLLFGGVLVVVVVVVCLSSLLFVTSAATSAYYVADVIFFFAYIIFPLNPTLRYRQKNAFYTQ